MQNVFLACRNILRIFNYRKFIFKFLDHPNQEQYKQYEQQWKTYETQMNQKRQDIEQRKTALENQLKQAQANGPPSGTPQAPNQWNNQQNSGNQWNSQRPEGYQNRGHDHYQGASQFSASRGPRNQVPRFDGPQQGGMGSQRFGGPRQRYDTPREGGPRYDGQFDTPNQGMDDSFQYEYNYDESADVDSRPQVPAYNRGRFDSNIYDDTKQFSGSNAFAGSRGGDFGGPRNSRFDSRGGGNQGGARFEPRGGAGRGGPRPGKGPVPLMALNIEKPKSLESPRNDDSFAGNQRSNRGRSPDNQFMGNGDEELLAKMGLPTSFGGNMNEAEEEQPQNLNKFRNPQGTGAQKSRWGGPRGPPLNRQDSQGDRQFPSASMGGGPRGPEPQGPPHRQDPYMRDSHQGHEREPWEQNQNWDRGRNTSWDYPRDRGPAPHRASTSPPRPQDTRQKTEGGVDASKVRFIVLYFG